MFIDGAATLTPHHTTYAVLYSTPTTPYHTALRMTCSTHTTPHHTALRMPYSTRPRHVQLQLPCTPPTYHAQVFLIGCSRFGTSFTQIQSVKRSPTSTFSTLSQVSCSNLHGYNPSNAFYYISIKCLGLGLGLGLGSHMHTLRWFILKF